MYELNDGEHMKQNIYIHTFIEVKNYEDWGGKISDEQWNLDYHVFLAKVYLQRFDQICKTFIANQFCQLLLLNQMVEKIVNAHDCLKQGN